MKKITLATAKIAKSVKSKTLLSLSLILIAAGLTSCLKDRTFPIPASAPTGTLVINEFMAYEHNSYGDEDAATTTTGEDWIEIYNGTDTTITLGNRWFLGDTIGATTKWQFPNAINGHPLTMLPKSYILVYCDNLVTPYIPSDSTHTQLHCSFRLGHTSGYVLLAHSVSGGAPIVQDIYQYGLQTYDNSWGRLPNGGSNWQQCTTPTPGAANQ